MIWDKRATSRPVASHAYMQAVEEDDLPWGGALRLDKVIETDSDPFLADGKHSLIRSLRYCRDHRGLLAVLSRTGQLRVFETKKERPLASVAASESPELLQVRRSHEMDASYSDPSRKSSRIVSFDWVTLGSPVLRPRLLVLRANGTFEILEQPSRASDHVFDMVPWQAPHRGLEEGTPYLELMKFEQEATPTMLGPLLVDRALSDIPIFGEESVDLEDAISSAVKPVSPGSIRAELINDVHRSLPESFYTSRSTAQKLRAIRAFVREELEDSEKSDALQSQLTSLSLVRDGEDGMPLASNGAESCREMHEALLSILTETPGLPREAQCAIDHRMLLRAKEMYLFDAVRNRDVVGDDPWIRFVWDWIAGQSDYEAPL